MYVNYNQPAFPTESGHYYGDGEFKREEVQPGMTLRDYFAAKAMQRIIPKCQTKNMHQDFVIPPDVIAESAYDIAEAMMREKAKRETPEPCKHEHIIAEEGQSTGWCEDCETTIRLDQ